MADTSQGPRREADRVKVYEFGPAYLLKLLKMICTEPAFLPHHSDIIKPWYFEQQVHVDLCREALDYHKRHKTGPTADAIEEAIFTLLSNDPRRSDKADMYVEVLQALRDTTIGEREDVTERAVAFARTQETVAAIEKAMDRMDEGKLDEIVPLMEAALKTGMQRQRRGTFYFDNLKRYERTRAQDTISTGFKNLDATLEGGLAVRELGVIAAPAKRGKSRLLANIVVGGLKDAADVVLFTHELNEDAYGRRLDGITLGVPSAMLKREKVAESLKLQAEKLRRTLYIRGFTPDEATVEDLRQELTWLRDEGHIAPGERKLLIVVDYGMLLKQPGQYDRDDLRHRAKYQGLIRIARDFDAALWSAMQTKQTAFDKEIVGPRDLGECYAIAPDCDILLTICQTKEEKEDDELRLFVALAREVEDGGMLNFTVDRKSGRMAATL